MTCLANYTSAARSVIAGLTLLFCSLGSAKAATWYIATNGSNNTPCGSATTPCATISYVLGNKVSAGDTISIMPGIYSNQGGININDSAKHSRITVTASDQANRPQLQNSTINIANGVSGVTISYLRIRGGSSPSDGYWGVIEISEYPTTIANNEIWNGGQGVFIRTSQQVQVTGNVIHDLGLPNTDYDAMGVLICNWQKDPVPSSFDNAIRITGNTIYNTGGDGLQENSYSEAKVQFNYLVIDNNRIYNNQEQGLDYKGTDDVRIYSNDIYGNGFGGISNNAAYGSTSRFDIYNNKIHDHTNFAIFDQGGGTNWRIWNNLVYNNNTSPWYNLAAVTLPADGNSHFYNNTVYNNRPHAGLNPNGNGSNVKNNIFWNNGVIGGPSSSPQGNIISSGGAPAYNFVYPTSPGVTGSNAVTVANPMLVSVASGDFSLQPGSPLIDKGTSLASPYNMDIVGTLRPQGSGVDIGANEYIETGTITLKSPSNLRVQ